MAPAARSLPDAVKEICANPFSNEFSSKRATPSTSVGGGDSSIPAISAASIIAKVRRDEIMRAMDAVYPEYGFRQHKGYATEDHRERLGRYGPCREHRRSFSPVSAMKSSSQ